MKACIYVSFKMKMNESKPSFEQIKKDIKRYYVLEKFIFMTNGNSVKFHQKWDTFSRLCEE